MNAATKNLLEEHQEQYEHDEPKGRTEKFRMRRVDHIKRTKRPTQFNGIHRRRRKKIWA